MRSTEKVIVYKPQTCLLAVGLSCLVTGVIFFLISVGTEMFLWKTLGFSCMGGGVLLLATGGTLCGLSVQRDKITKQCYNQVQSEFEVETMTTCESTWTPHNALWLWHRTAVHWEVPKSCPSGIHVLHPSVLSPTDSPFSEWLMVTERDLLPKHWLMEQWFTHGLLSWQEMALSTSNNSLLQRVSDSERLTPHWMTSYHLTSNVLPLQWEICALSPFTWLRAHWMNCLIAPQWVCTRVWGL